MTLEKAIQRIESLNKMDIKFIENIKRIIIEYHNQLLDEVENNAPFMEQEKIKEITNFIRK